MGASVALARSFTALTVCLLLVGCGSASKAKRDQAQQKKAGDDLTERYDLNGDGKPDLEKVYSLSKDADGQEVKTLVEKRLDLDHNGRFDMISRYDEGERLVSESVDLDFDGTFDGERKYENGLLVEEQLSPGFDGNTGVWRYFGENGELVRKARDTNSNGRPDTWEYFAEGRIVRYGFDRDGDGQPEYFEDAVHEE